VCNLKRGGGELKGSIGGHGKYVRGGDGERNLEAELASVQGMSIVGEGTKTLSVAKMRYWRNGFRN